MKCGMRLDAPMFFEISRDLFCVVNPNGLFRSVNPAWTATLGWTEAELLSRPVMEFIYPPDHARTNLVRTELESGRGIHQFENRYFHKDGSLRWLDWTAVSDANSGLVYALARDVTEQKVSKERLELAFSSVGMGVWDWDVRQDRLIWDESMYCLYGCRREDMSGLVGGFDFWQKVVHPEDLPRAVQAVDDAIMGRKKFDTEFRILHSDGTIHHIRGKGTVLRDPSGVVTRMIGVNWDVTRQRQSEQEIRAYQTRAAIDDKMVSLAEMAAGVAHEINNPLAIIQGKSSMLRESLLSGVFSVNAAVEALSKIESTVARIAKIVRGLRMFSRKSENDPFSIVTLSSIVDDVRALSSAQMENLGISLKVKVPDDLYIYCRPAQVAQVLINLINNAMDAIVLEDARWIEIQASRQDGHVEVRVMDSGKGVPAEMQDKIMQPFFTTKEVGKGTGLGLSISKGIVEDHGGRLLLDTTQKQTCFVMELPLEQCVSPGQGVGLTMDPANRGARQDAIQAQERK